MHSINKMSPFQNFVNFGVSIGMPDCSAVSFVNRFTAKPIDYFSSKENYSNGNKIGAFISKHVVTRIIGATASAFAALDLVYNLLVSLGKLPLATLKKSGIKKIPESCSFSGIRDHLKNAYQSANLITGGSLLGLIAPQLFAKFSYPVSEKNKIPIFGYHEISNEIKDPWTISPELFYNQLKYLHENNYQLCTMKELNEGYQPPEEKKLAVITFDDSHESQLRLLDNNTIDPTCAIGVFNKMKEDHPGFRCAATFYVNTSEESGTTGDTPHTLFSSHEDQKEHTAHKLNYLQKNGFEIGSHGHKHRVFKKLSREELQEDIHLFDETIRSVGLNPTEIVSFAWPHGISAKHRDLFDARFRSIADFGFHTGKVNRDHMDSHKLPRIFIGPNTGFEKFL